MTDGLGVFTGGRRNQDADDPSGDPDQKFAGVERALALLDEAADEASEAAPDFAAGIRAIREVGVGRLEEVRREESAEETEEEPEANSRQYHERPGPKPQSSSFESGAAFRAAMEKWRRKNSEHEGKAIRRGRTPAVLLPHEDD